MKTTIILALICFSSQTLASSILESVQALAKENKSSIVIMDLDETVIDTHTRKFLSFQEALKELCGDPAQTLYYPKNSTCEKAMGLSVIDFYRIENGYSWQQLMQRVGIRDGEFIQSWNKKMVDIYLSGRWMEIDSVIPGANSYVRELKRLGVEIFFISSRFEDTMSEGTFAQLKRLGFMAEGETHQVILRKRGEDSLSFKTNAVKKVQAYSLSKDIPIIGLFENEPENLNAWSRVFPQAKAILIKGNILVPTEPSPEIVIVDDFRNLE